MDPVLDSIRVIFNFFRANNAIFVGIKIGIKSQLVITIPAEAISRNRLALPVY